MVRASLGLKATKSNLTDNGLGRERKKNLYKFGNQLDI